MSAKKLKRESAFARASSCCSSWRLLAVTALVGALAVLVTFLRLHWAAPASDLGIKFLINADQSKVVEAFRSASPHLFYCHEHGNPDYVPKKLQVAHQIMGVGDYRLAVMNCSQELPSGLQIFDRFKLKREWRPVVFATAPWLTGRVQVPPAKFAKKEGGLHAANYMLSALRPREKVIANDKEFQTTCGTISSSFGITELKSCVLALKGPLFSETQQDVLGHLVKTFHSTPLSIMSVNSKSRWLSMESSFVMSRKYSMRLYVIRNGTHYATLNLPPTKESSVEFVRNFVEAPTSSFTASSSGIKLIKPPMISAAAESAAPRRKSTTEKNIANDMPSGKSNPGENEELQRQREQQRREQMDKQSENYIFIDNSDEYPLDAACDDMDESDVGEEDDEVIELF